MRVKDCCAMTAVLAVMASCGAKSADDKAGAPKQEPEQELRVLAMPRVPDSLTDARARADYATLHFWDALDFADRALCLDTASMEQNFANYLALMSVASPEVAAASVSSVVGRTAEGGSGVFHLFRYIADKYVGDPNSPMRNNELYICFLQAFSECGLLDKDDRQRVDYRLGQAMKNRRGSTATDFPIDLRDGTRSTLHRECSRAATTLLVFYDPDCDHCKAVIGELAAATLRPDVQVLAVDFVGDRRLWERTLSAMPSQWNVGIAATDLEGGDLYSFPASPTLYILDRHAKVTAKDPDHRLAIHLLE